MRETGYASFMLVSFVFSVPDGGTSSLPASLRGLFYKKAAVPQGPSGTYYGGGVVINHGRASVPTPRLPQSVSSGRSLAAPLSFAPTWTRLFLADTFLFFFFFLRLFLSRRRDRLRMTSAGERQTFIVLLSFFFVINELLP